MKHRIDPTVDCVFKALLGSEQNKNLLIDFLNAVIAPEHDRRISAVKILNPYNEKEFPSDKLSIVDIKAMDKAGRIYQVEVQVSTYGALAARMSYVLCDLYASQLNEGKNYTQLKPVIAIWVIAELLLQDTQFFHHHFQLYDSEHSVLLHDHLSLHVLELEKWNKAQVEGQIDRWVKFLREGKNLDDENLPEYMQTKEMVQAMSTLRQFSEKEQNYHQYQARQNYLRERSCIEEERNQAVQERNQAVQKLDQAVQKLDQSKRERDQSEQERDQAVQKLDQSEQERDQAVQKLDQALEELEKLRRYYQKSQ